MRAIQRRPLSEGAQAALLALTTDVVNHPDPSKKAQTSWDHKPKSTFDEVRAVLEDMAPGLQRCMYCEDSAGTDIEHFRPKSVYPALAFCWENYLLACSHCNSNYKRSSFPVDPQGEPLLIDPTSPVDDPVKHLLLTVADFKFQPLDAKGEATIEVFGLNARSPLVRGRKNTLNALVALLRRYDQQHKDDPSGAAETKACIVEFPFSGVLFWLVKLTQGEFVPAKIDAETVRIVRAHQVATWL
jgi:uncharacterized protein (TIGR02646 family)